MSNVELCEYGKCTQCYACQTVCPKKCITFVPADDGFLIPEIDRSVCVECGTCMKACHQINVVSNFKIPVKTYACWTKNVFDRENSSSGGAFSVIARKVINEGGIVFGASMCKDLKVRHIAVERQEDLILLQGSKYVQSYLEDVYLCVKNELYSGRKVLFSGTPCQVAGLYCFLKKDYSNLYTCDLVCHGVPSQKAFDIYIEKLGLTNRCEDFYFRYTKGWGFQLAYMLKSNNGNTLKRTIVSPKKAYYLRAFTNGLMFNESCYHCAYARSERISDFTFADFWGLGVRVPFKYSKSKGISCLLINNEKALCYIKNCEDLEFVERPFEEAVEGNYNLSHVSVRPVGRDTYFEDSCKMKVKELCGKYGIKAKLRDYLRIIKQTV